MSSALPLCLMLLATTPDNHASTAPQEPLPDGLTVDSSPSQAEVPPGKQRIHWVEHRIDSADVNGGLALRGGDGLAEGDLDGDGLLDVVSVHEDSGHVRIAFGEGPGRWENHTLADTNVDGVEDVVLVDMDNDQQLDIVLACERGHILLVRNPGHRRAEQWPRAIPEITLDRGSYIRVSAGDFDGDGIAELAVANKGAVMHGAGTESKPGKATIKAILGAEPAPISLLNPPANPFSSDGWEEWELGRTKIPINAAGIDIDGDGDLDVIGGGRGEFRGLLLFENTAQGNSGEPPVFTSRLIRPDTAGKAVLAQHGIPTLNGQTLKFHDFNGDGRLDILTAFTLTAFGWLEQPEDMTQPWQLHLVGSIAPDHIIGFALADIDEDGSTDVLTGGYSKVARDGDRGQVGEPLGRLAWFRAVDPAGTQFQRFDISRRIRGMFDDFIARDVDGDGDIDFIGTRGNSGEFDGLFWLEQKRSSGPVQNFRTTATSDSPALPLPQDAAGRDAGTNSDNQ